MPDFSIRSKEPEIMDDLAFSDPVILQTLKELEVINKYLGGNDVTVSGIKRLLRKKNWNKNSVLRIADLGCGSGDMLRIIARWARKNHIKTELVGVDANPVIIEFAKKRSRGFPEITYLTENIFSESFNNKQFEIITSTLFCHHFTTEELTELFKKWNRNASLGIVINDLHRHWFAYYSIKCLTGIFSRSYMVKYDSAISVLRGFKRKELREIFKRSGIEKWDLKWKWAFRFQIIIH